MSRCNLATAVIRTHRRHIKADLNPTGRSQSILLDERNPILNPRTFKPRKTTPPRPNGVQDALPSGSTLSSSGASGNPYLRMLASPLRRCLISEQYLPMDFLIRLGVARIPTSETTPDPSKRGDVYVLPDGVEHPRFCEKKSYRGYYVPCWKDDFVRILAAGQLARIYPKSKLHSLLSAQTAHALRARVLQELVLLAERVRTVPLATPVAPPLQRLTRQEYLGFVNGHGSLDKSAVAVLTMPPPQDAMAASFPLTADYPPADATQSSTAIYRTSPDGPYIPLYKGPALFRTTLEQQRIWQSLARFLHVSRREKRKTNGGTVADADGLSDAYLICSQGGISPILDTVPLAIALRRLGLWEGDGWRDQSDP